jgi:hypothetical protein
MVPLAQKWNKIAEYMWVRTKSKIVLRNGKICKDKWNSINGDYKNISNYHKSMGHNTSYWDLSLEDWDKFHLSEQLNEDCYNAIEEHPCSIACGGFKCTRRWSFSWLINERKIGKEITYKSINLNNLFVHGNFLWRWLHFRGKLGTSGI